MNDPYLNGIVLMKGWNRKYSVPRYCIVWLFYTLFCYLLMSIHVLVLSLTIEPGPHILRYEYILNILPSPFLGLISLFIYYFCVGYINYMGLLIDYVFKVEDFCLCNNGNDKYEFAGVLGMLVIMGIYMVLFFNDLI